MNELNLTRYSATALLSKEFSLFLKEENGALFRFDIERNGQVIQHSGQFTFFCNPEDMTKEWGARNLVTQTPHGAWVDSFGMGLPRWTLHGQTGWRARNRDIGLIGQDTVTDGYLAFHAFQQLIETYFNENQERARESLQPGAPMRPLLQLHFYDHADDDFWLIEPEGVPTKRRSNTRPLIIEYVFRFTGVQSLKVKVFAPPDPTGTALLGGPDRLRKIGESGTAAVADLEEVLEAWDLAAMEFPTDAAEADLLFGEMTELDNDGRTRVAAAALDAKNGVEEAEAAGRALGDLSPGMAAALQTASEAADALGQKSGLDGLESIAEGTTTLTEALQTLKEAPIVSVADQAVKDLLSNPALDALKSAVTNAHAAAVAAGTTTAGWNFVSITKAIGGVITQGETLFAQVNGVVQGVAGSISMGFGVVNGFASRIRNIMGGVGFLLQWATVAKRLQSGLRLLRTNLRNMLCAVQSILNFPENFVGNLKDTLSGIKALFKLSGCATSFPSVKGVSW